MRRIESVIPVRHRGEEGMALPMVLALLVLVAVVLPAVLERSAVVQVADRVSERLVARTEAAQSGIRTALEQIASGGSLCADGKPLWFLWCLR